MKALGRWRLNRATNKLWREALRGDQDSHAAVLVVLGVLREHFE